VRLRIVFDCRTANDPGVMPIDDSRTRLQLNFYLNAARTPLKVPKHFMSAIRSLINSMSKLCRVDKRAAKGTFPTVSLKPFDSFLDLLATFRTCNFERQIVEKHGLIHRMNKTSSFSKYRSCEDT
jgi:hypothetical protein